MQERRIFMDETRELENPDVITVDYGVYFYEVEGERREFYIFDLKSFLNKIPKSLHTIIMPLSHNSDDYMNQIMDNNKDVGVFLCESEMFDDGDYDIEDNYYSDYKMLNKWIRIHYEPISGKSFKCNHHFTMDLTDLYNKLDEENQSRFPFKKQLIEIERLSENLHELMYDWYTDGDGIRNPVKLLENKLLLTEEEKKLLYK